MNIMPITQKNDGLLYIKISRKSQKIVKVLD